VGKDMRVDTEKLQAVAARVQQLHDDLAGASLVGSFGKLGQVGSQNITAALGGNGGNPMDGDGNGGSAFAHTYDMEHSGLTETYKSLIGQLQELQQRCTTTASLHQTNETTNQKVVTQSGGEL
jgi:hypothetical protein